MMKTNGRYRRQHPHGVREAVRRCIPACLTMSALFGPPRSDRAHGLPAAMQRLTGKGNARFT